MKKLHLDLDALEVESFDTESTTSQRGTVEAHVPYYCCYCCCCCCCCTCGGSCGGTCYGQYTCPGYYTCETTCKEPSCPGVYSCDVSCAGSCDTCPGQYSCDDTCFASCYYTECYKYCGYESDGYRLCPIEPY